MIEQRVIIGAGAALDHADEDEIVGGIDPEPGTGGAIPEEGSLAVGQVGAGGLKMTAQS